MEIEVGKTYLTQNGHSVRIIATDRMGKYPIVGLLFERDGKETVQDWTAQGLYFACDPDYDLNLIIPPKRKSRWVNWSKDMGFLKREDADIYARPGRTHVIELITEDGELVATKIHKV